MLDEYIHGPRVAYFSMEIALRNEIPTYAGGLGVLAGDTMRSAADLALPLVAVSLVSRAGYFRQQIDAQGRQVEHAALWEPGDWAQPLDAKIAVTIEGRAVWIGAWLYVIEGHMGGRQPVLLLDTDLDENRPDDRDEGHSALLVLELLRRYGYPPDGLRPGESPYDLPRVRELCNTHTPVEAGHDHFSYGLAGHVLGPDCRSSVLPGA